MWELEHKEGWVPKNWWFWIVVLEKTLWNLYKEIKPVNSKGNQPWIVVRRIDTEAEAPILWPPNVKNQLIGNDPDTRKDWKKGEGAAEDEMVRQHHPLNGFESEQTLGDSEGQGSLASWNPWGQRQFSNATVTATINDLKLEFMKFSGHNFNSF